MITTRIPSSKRGEDIITINNDYDFSTRHQSGRTIHLKGFASRLDQHEPRTHKMARSLVQRLKRLKPAQMVWDGDNFATNSFTNLLPYIYEALDKDVELVAFVRECDQERFIESWQPKNLPISLYLCPDVLDWQKLGTHALAITGSDLVVCFGGGDTVTDEFEARPRAAIEFIMFSVTRPTSDGANLEHSPLETCVAPSLEVVASPIDENWDAGIYSSVERLL